MELMIEGVEFELIQIILVLKAAIFGGKTVELEVCITKTYLKTSLKLNFFL